MKKFILLIVMMLVITLAGCTITDETYLDIEKVYQDCNGVATCEETIDAILEKELSESETIKEIVTALSNAEIRITNVETNLLESETELANIKAELLTTKAELSLVKEKVDTNEINIADINLRITQLEYRVKALESVVYGESETYSYINDVLEVPISIYKYEEKEITYLEIDIQVAIDRGYVSADVISNLKNCLYQDLNYIIDQDKVIITIFENGKDDLTFNLTDLVP